jgi:hypothetical protein
VVGEAAAVVADGGLDVVRQRVEAPQQVLDGARPERGVPLQGVVQVVRVGGMVLAVVDLHRAGIDVRLEGRRRVRQAGSSKAMVSPFNGNGLAACPAAW